MKRTIWVALNKRHNVASIWVSVRFNNVSFSNWKKYWGSNYTFQKIEFDV